MRSASPVLRVFFFRLTSTLPPDGLSVLSLEGVEKTEYKTYRTLAKELIENVMEPGGRVSTYGRITRILREWKELSYTTAAASTIPPSLRSKLERSRYAWMDHNCIGISALRMTVLRGCQFPDDEMKLK